MLAAVCPTRQELMDGAVGKLSNEDLDGLSKHLETCPHCQAELATLPEPNDALVTRLRGPAPPDPYQAEPGCDVAVARAMAAVAKVNRAVDLPRQLGEYQLTEELGHGGMGTVYKALHTKLGRIVALKVLTLARAQDRSAVARFEREMQAIGQLDHRHIVRAHDAREIDGTPILVMEYLDGLDLAEIVRRLGALEVPEACELARQAAVGLQTIHEHGLVHRDIKPSNLMLTADGEVKILDLGLARLRLAERPIEEVTGTGQGLGTIDYMAPEQGADSREVDIRADIYSLGCTLFKLLAGRAPFSGEGFRTTLEKLNAHAHQPPPSVQQFNPAVPDEVAAILERMLAKEPEARFATPAEVAEALAPHADGADLPALLAQAVAHDPGSAVNDQVEEPAQPPTAATSGHGRRVSLSVAIGLMLAGFGMGLALGIMIRIHKDGRETTVEVPEGSHTQVSATGDVDVALPGQAQPAAKVQQPQEPPLQFGPVIERVVNAVGEGKGSEGLNLATGKLVDVPKEFGQWSAQQRDKWSAENNVDLLVDLLALTDMDSGWPDKKWLALTPQGLKLAAAWDRWEIATGKELHSALMSVTVGFAPSPHEPNSGMTVCERHGVIYYVPRIGGQQPITSAFRTRKGDLGLLQVIRLTEEPRGMRIRYKLAQPPVATAVRRGTALLYFFGDWVGPCRATKPVIDTLAGEGYAVQRVNVDQEPELARRFRVTSIPCFVVLEQGIEVDRIVGAAALPQLRAALQRASAAASPGASTPSPAADLKALQGSWEVERIEKGKAAADRLWICASDALGNRPEDVTRFQFNPPDCQIIDMGEGSYRNFFYRIDTAATPKSVDLLARGDRGVERAGELIARGVYDFDGDRLQLCFSSYPPMTGDVRPKQIQPNRLSGDVLFVLRRCTPADDNDQKLLRGDWAVAAETDDGRAVAAAELRDRRYAFHDCNLHMPGMEGSFPGALFALDSVKEPKRITIPNVGFVPEKATEWFALHGIYKFDAGRLTIAYRKDGPVPEKFESPPGSGVTLLVLSKVPQQKPQPVPATATAPKPPPTVSVVHPVVRQVTDHVDASQGLAMPAQIVEIRARVTGNLEKVYFKAGATVQKGDVLAEIDARIYRAELEAASSAAAQAKINLESRTKEFERVRALGFKNTSQHAFDEAKAQRDQAEAALRVATAKQEVAKLHLESTRITAPFAGTIRSSMPSVGNLVTADETVLTTLDSTDPMMVDFFLDERVVRTLRGAAGGKPDWFTAIPVVCRLAGDKDYCLHATLDSVESQVQTNGEIRCRAVLPNPQGTLLRGTTINVRLITSPPHPALLIPRLAVRGDSITYEPYVLVVNDHSVVERRKVQMGAREGDFEIVTDGLTTADRVITHFGAISRPSPGTTVTPEPDQPPASPPPPTAKPSGTAAGASASPAGSAANVNPAADLKALQGLWKVVGVRRGKAAAERIWSWSVNASVAPGQRPEDVTRFEFNPQECLALDIDEPGPYPRFPYRVGRMGSTRTIDLYSLNFAEHPSELLARGVYDAQGDRLRLCFQSYPPSMVGNLRPAQVEPAPDSGDVLFELQRYTPSGDEQRIMGDWAVVGEVDDGRALSTAEIAGPRGAEAAHGPKPRPGRPDDRPMYSFRHGTHNLMPSAWGDASTTEYGRDVLMAFVWDDARQPRAITIGRRDNTPLRGIYEIDGSRMTIAYRRGGQRPEKFESTPGSGVTLVVLEKATVKPGKAPASSQAPGGNKTATTTGQKDEGPDRVVFAFLEAARTGNEDNAAKMLTPLARRNVAQQHFMVAPSGTATAHFDVGAVQLMAPDAARVSVEWSDLDDKGNRRTDDFVWMLRRVDEGWRIIGVAAPVFAGEPPLLLNFESPDGMAEQQKKVRDEIQRRAKQATGPVPARIAAPGTWATAPPQAAGEATPPAGTGVKPR